MILLARNGIALLLLALVAACSMQGLIEGMTSEEDRAMAQQFVEDIRTGNSEGLQTVVVPELWQNSASDFEQAATLFPRGESETQITSYSMHMENLNANARTEKEFTLVTSDGSHWTTTRFSTVQEGGPQQITAWNVEGSSEVPQEIAVMEGVGTVMMWIGIGALLFVIGIVVLIVWLVKRSNRKARERAGIS